MHHSKLALIKSIGSQWVSVIYGAAVMFFLLIFLARKLGPSSLAIFLYIQTIASLFAILQDGGFQALLFREKVAPSEKTGITIDAIVSGYFGYISMTTLLGLAAVLLFPVAFKTGFLLAFCYFAFRCLTNLVSFLLKGQGSFKREALWRIQLNTIVALPVLLLIGFTTPTPEKVFLGFIIGQLLILATKNGRKIFSGSKITLPPWRLWKTCLSFVVIYGASMIYFRSSIVLLKHLQPDLALVGYYGAALQLLEGVIFLAAPVAHMAFRYMRLSWLNRKTFNERFGRILTGAAAAAFLLTTTGILFAPKFILLAYGKAYGPAADILPLLLFSLMFILPNLILTQGIIALNGERYYAVAASLCAVFNVGMNFFLIPQYLATGAAISTVATEALLTLLLGGWFILWRRTRMTAQGVCGKSEKDLDF
jgi:O-antigen/teichoic acid export membrane protein